MGAKFFITVGVLVPAVLAIAAVGAMGLSRMNERTTSLYDDHLRTVQDSADLVAAMYAIYETALFQVAAHNPATDAKLAAELDQRLIPRLEQTITILRGDYVGKPPSLQKVNRIEAGLREYFALRRTGTSAATSTSEAALAERIDEIFEPLVQTGEQLRTEEARQASQTKRESDAAYRSTLLLLAASVIAVLLLGLGAVLALIHNLVPRIRRYSQFAADVAAGRPTATLRPRGHDELAELGSALNDMVRQREQVSLSEQAQAEFVDTLQVTGTEEEAQDLVQRHLQRSLPGSAVVVLRRNNSANRLEAATALSADSELAARLVGADPQSCAALRIGRTHREGTGRPPLLGCALCGDRDLPSTCEPLLVGGEVIGSVLVTHHGGCSDADQTRIKTTVTQAAPMLANLRNLALAEFRANNDSLTGLPNKRATEDTLKRMVAQAIRSITPLAAAILDLDHFKAVNDRFGHGKGDEVLAAVGAAVQSCLRASDFAGRFGGEEFLILLPETTAESALQVAERIRTTIASITVPGVESDITASLGVADLFENAGNATGLLRQADRALYAAKAAGRNRTVVSAATDRDRSTSGAPAQL